MSLKILKSDLQKAQQILSEVDQRYKPGTKSNNKNKTFAFQRVSVLEKQINDYHLESLTSVAFESEGVRYYATFVKCSDEECLELLQANYPNLMPLAKNIQYRHYESNTLFTIKS